MWNTALVTSAEGCGWVFLMANTAQKVYVTCLNSLEMIVYEWQSVNGIVMKKQDINWS